ncbi:MAG: Cof-type HAD-IIB family hydrolase [Metamycoplasmataceae bacterium]
MKKWIITDLDGTLLSHKENHEIEIVDEAVKAINLLDENQYYFTIATGRHYKDVLDLINKFKIKFLKNMYIIGVNGNQIYSTKENELILNNFLSPEALKTFDGILEYMYNEFGQETMLYGYNDLNETFLIDNNFSTFPKMVEKLKSFENNELIYKVYKNYKEIENIYKLCFYIQKEINIEELVKKLEQINDHFTFVYTGDCYLEIMNKGVSKQSSIEYINNHYYHIDKENIIAFGDAGNDYLMLKNAGIAITNEKAKDKIKEISNFIYKEEPSYFVARGIRELVLNKKN